MNLGKTILELRKKKNVTQDELAAELGVTAAAVSKWENGYTLPDILMLCALADYFQVTTDELLGRSPKPFCAAVAASSPELLDPTEALLKQYGFRVKHKIYGSYDEALDIINKDPSVTHLFISFDESLESRPEITTQAHVIESCSDSPQKILDGFEIYLKNMPNFDALVLKKDK